MEDNKKTKFSVVSFIIGLLIGAIISTGAIYFYTLAANTGAGEPNVQQGAQMPGTPPNGENGGTPPSEAPTNNMQQNQ